MSKTKTYTVQIKCSNCNHIGPIELPKGTPVPMDGKMKCPNCECDTAEKHNAVSSLPFIKNPWSEIYPRKWTEPDRTWLSEPIPEPSYPFKVTC